MERVVGNIQSAELFTPTGGTPARLSLQLPGCPTPAVQRIMMLLESEAPAQKATAPVEGVQVKVPLLLEGKI